MVGGWQGTAGFGAGWGEPRLQVWGVPGAVEGTLGGPGCCLKTQHRLLRCLSLSAACPSAQPPGLQHILGALPCSYDHMSS